MTQGQDRLHPAGSKQAVHLPRSQLLRQIWKDYQWAAVLTLLGAAFMMGYVGFAKYTKAIGQIRQPTDLIYLTLQLATLESGAVSGPVSWELEVARWLVPILTAYTALLAAAILFKKQLEMLKMHFLRDHIVICGLGEKGTLLASSLCQRGLMVVAIENDESNPGIHLCREYGVIVLEGDATEPSILRKTSIHRASHLVSVCGDDCVNVEVAMIASRLSSKRKHGALNCRIHIVSPQLCELLREHEFGIEAFPTFRLEMFNIYERGARAMLRNYPFFDHDAKTIPAGPHILVIGLGRLGENLVIQAAREWYERTMAHGDLLRVSMVDCTAQEIAASLNNRYPKLSDCCELTPYSIEMNTTDFEEARFLFNSQNQSDIDLIFICLGEQTLGLQSALNLRQELESDQPPIVVRMNESSGLARLLTEEDADSCFHNIIPFGLLQQTCVPELVLGGTHEILAQAVHEDYLCRLLDEGLELGQKRSLVHWDQLPEDLRESNRRQVDHIRLKLHAAGYGIKPLVDWEAASYKFEPESVELMAKMEHEHWVQERQRNGWRYEPGLENDTKKTHPDLLPWEQLPEPAKDKDRQPMIELPRLLFKSGFEVHRLNESS